MKNKIIRTIRLLFLISIILLVFSLRRTYAKYQEKFGATYNVKMKGWYIKLNNEDVYEMTSLNEVVMPIECNNEYLRNNVATNIFVPGAEKYLLFVIDYSKVDLKFAVDIDIKQTTTNNLDFLGVKGYTYGVISSNTLYGDEQNLLRNSSIKNIDNEKHYTIHEVIDAPNLTDKQKYIKVYINWDDTKKDERVMVEGVSVEKNRYDTLYIGDEILTNVANEFITETTKTKVTYDANIQFTQVAE